MFAYSAQRGDWTSPGPHVYADSAVLGENVLWLEDGGRLWAFGSLCEGHVWYDWPNGTEYHIPADGLIQAAFPIPAGLQPVKHFFFQPLILNGMNQVYLGNRFDPAWIF
ncbi:MAG: hypothetical protein CMJ89_10470 [Planctomycetes bacterium]|nr:hypothetical protein [Planctomycetota bacterium]